MAVFRALSGGGNSPLPYTKSGEFTCTGSGATITDIGFLPSMFIAWRKDETDTSSGSPFYLIYAKDTDSSQSDVHHYLWWRADVSAWYWYGDLPITNTTIGQFVIGNMGGSGSCTMCYLAVE